MAGQSHTSGQPYGEVPGTCMQRWYMLLGPPVTYRRYASYKADTFNSGIFAMQLINSKKLNNSTNRKSENKSIICTLLKFALK